MAGVIVQWLLASLQKASMVFNTLSYILGSENSINNQPVQHHKLGRKGFLV